MKYVCDAPDRKSWFRIETEAEAERESMLMDHAVAKYFRREREDAIRSYSPPSTIYAFEQNIGLQAHIQREMPLFLTPELRIGIHQALEMYAADAPQPRRCHALRSPAF